MNNYIEMYNKENSKLIFDNRTESAIRAGSANLSDDYSASGGLSDNYLASGGLSDNIDQIIDDCLKEYDKQTKLLITLDKTIHEINTTINHINQDCNKIESKNPNGYQPVFSWNNGVVYYDDYIK